MLASSRANFVARMIFSIRSSKVFFTFVLVAPESLIASQFPTVLSVVIS